MTKEAYYFSHDANARNDVKIVKLRRVLGLEGYAIYFCLIEILREQKDHRLPLNSVSDIAFDLRTSEEKINGVISGFDLFLIEADKFFSARLLRSMGEYNNKKLKLSESGKKGNEIRWGQQTLLLPQSGGDGEAIALKEIKEKGKYILFDNFWGIYGYKVSKSDAEKAWNKLKDEQKFECIAKLPKWLEHQKSNKKFMPYPATFINQKRWEDELEDFTDVEEVVDTTKYANPYDSLSSSI